MAEVMDGFNSSRVWRIWSGRGGSRDRRLSLVGRSLGDSAKRRLGSPCRPERVARDVAIRGDTVLVLAGNYWEFDRYESAAGQYLDSVLLPVPLCRASRYRDPLQWECVLWQEGQIVQSELN